MKRIEAIHVFSPAGRKDITTCMVKIAFNNWDKGPVFVLFENLGDGVSVTNASEQLATEIIDEYKLNLSITRFFETYQEYDYETFDEITYSWSDRKASNPNWKPAEEIRKHFKL